MFRKDDAWTIEVTPRGSTGAAPSEPQEPQQRHHLQITKVLKNDFPATFAAEVLYTLPGQKPQPWTMNIQTTSASGAAMSSNHRYGSKSDHTHVIMPLSGKLVEVLVDAGDVVRKDEPVCVIKQMKMEIEVRSHRAGVVTWVTEAEDGEDVAEGMLAAVVDEERAQAKL
jgi:biotin carboxyl carrier protein